MSDVFPIELIERIIDHAHEDLETLQACSLVHSSWLSGACLHLFEELNLPSPPTSSEEHGPEERTLSTLTELIKDGKARFPSYVSRLFFPGEYFVDSTSSDAIEKFLELAELFNGLNLRVWINSCTFTEESQSTDIWSAFAPNIRELYLQNISGPEETELYSDWDETKYPVLEQITIFRGSPDSGMRVLRGWLDGLVEKPAIRRLIVRPMMDGTTTQDGVTQNVDGILSAIGGTLEELELACPEDEPLSMSPDLSSVPNLKVLHINLEIFVDENLAPVGGLPDFLSSVSELGSLEKVLLSAVVKTTHETAEDPGTRAHTPWTSDWKALDNALSKVLKVQIDLQLFDDAEFLWEEKPKGVEQGLRKVLAKCEAQANLAFKSNVCWYDIS